MKRTGVKGKRVGAVLEATCKEAVDFFEVDHAALVLFDHTNSYGRVRAEFPEHGAKGLRIPVRGIPLEERLIHEREPIVVRDVRSMTTLGTVGSNLLRLGVNSLLIVPVVVRRKVIGSFSLDVFEPRHRSFSEHDVRRCKVFADRVGAAIENAAFAEELDTLRHVTFALTSSRRTRESLLKMIIQSAVALLQAKTGGLYEYFPDKKQLVVSDHGYPSSTGGYPSTSRPASPSPSLKEQPTLGPYIRLQ